MDLLSIFTFIFIILIIPFAIFFWKSFRLYQLDGDSVSLFSFLKFMFYLSQTDNKQLRKYRAYSIFYAIGLNVVIIGLVLFILLNYN